MSRLRASASMMRPASIPLPPEEKQLREISMKKRPTKKLLMSNLKFEATEEIWATGTLYLRDPKGMRARTVLGNLIFRKFCSVAISPLM